jgi:membrane protein
MSERDEIPIEENVPDRASGQVDRGRHATSPTQVPKKGWKDILWRTKAQLDEDNLSIVAAGIAFYAFVAVVPSLAVAIAIYALVSDASDLTRHLGMLSQVVPAEVMPMLEEQITRIATEKTSAGVSAILGVLIALYSSSNATKAIITGLNIAYDETEKRGFVKLTAMAIGLTLSMIVGVILILGLIAVLPAVMRSVGLGSGAELAISILRWPLLVAVFLTGLAVVYRYAPCRDEPQWKWVSPGTLLATSLWIAGSALFSLYVSAFGSYDKTYGSLGAVVVFLMWLYLSAYVILLGAELNSEIERQTLADTTKGPERPLGQRSAYAADTVGPEHESVRPAVKSGATKKR